MKEKALVLGELNQNQKIIYAICEKKCEADMDGIEQWRIMIVNLRKSPQGPRYLGSPELFGDLVFSLTKRILGLQINLRTSFSPQE